MSTRVLWLALALAVLLAPSARVVARDADLPPQLAFIGLRAGKWQLFLGDAGGPRVVPTASEPRTPAYAPSKKRIAYVSAEGELREIDLASGADSMLLRGSKDAAFTQPVYRPGSDELYFVVLKQGVSVDTDIARFDRTARQPVPVVRQRSAQFEPTFSPDGSRLVYSSVLCGSECTNIIQEVWSMELVSGVVEQLTSLGAISRQPTLGPRGVLTFSSNEAGAYTLWQRAANGRVSQLTRASTLDETPVATDTGDLYFVRRDAVRGRLMRQTGMAAAREVALPADITELRDLRWGR